MLNAPTYYNYTLRKANKQHTCCECEGKIEEDETYYFHYGVWDGQWYNFKVCSDCGKLREECEKYIRRNEAIPFGGLGDEVNTSRNVRCKEKFNEIVKDRSEELEVEIHTTYSLTHVAPVKLPVASWKEIQGWYVKWGRFFYTLDGTKWDEVDLNEWSDPDEMDTKRPNVTKICTAKTKELLDGGSL